MSAALSSVRNSAAQVRAKGRAQQAEQSIQDKKIAFASFMIPFMSANSFFLRRLEGAGFTKQTIDRLIKQLELTRITRTILSKNWALSSWWGLSGGFATITNNLGMRLTMSNLLSELRSLKAALDAEKLKKDTR